MRVIFMGSPAFAATILTRLAAAHEVVCVVTAPDKVRSRGNKTDPTPVKVVAEALGLDVMTPKTLRDAAFQEELASFGPDAICVAACGFLLPKEVLALPTYGCLNVHGSLLPRWRGAAPIERAILAGDVEAGICIMRMEEGLDTGPYCRKVSASIGSKTAEELTEELSFLGANALIAALEDIQSGSIEWVSQDETLVTYADKLSKTELYWTLDDSAIEAERKVRASSDAHRCKTIIAGRRVDILTVKIAEGCHQLARGEAGFIDGRLIVGFGEEALEILRLKPEGKHEMLASDFARGMQALKAGNATWEPAL